jgi:hypothetical protein
LIRSKKKINEEFLFCNEIMNEDVEIRRLKERDYG